MSTQNSAVGKARRDHGLKAMLTSHRSQLAHDVRERMRAVRHDGITRRDVVDDAESSEADIQDDVGVAVLQLAAETLEKIEAALRRLDGGEFGACVDCGDDIADARLRAVPFALRCRACEARSEAAGRHVRSTTWRDVSALGLEAGSRDS